MSGNAVAMAAGSLASLVYLRYIVSFLSYTPWVNASHCSIQIPQLQRTSIHTFELSGKFSGKIRQTCEVEYPQVLSFTAHSVRGGREATPRARIPADISHMEKSGHIRENTFAYLVRYITVIRSVLSALTG